MIIHLNKVQHWNRKVIIIILSTNLFPERTTAHLECESVNVQTRQPPPTFEHPLLHAPQ